MATNTLSLPIDIPWKRLCVSEDMIDPQVCERVFPFRWRSSVAVFEYRPPEDYQTYEGMIVSYLKVVYTITGFQADPEEVGLKNRKINSYWNDPAVIENYKDIVGQYYGCYGAILEVSVAPSGDDVGLGKFPYFADFEPKKRELYEIVSETGEIMSRSLENINVRKGATTTDTHEVVDIFGGFSQQFQYAGTGGGHSITGQWGTRDVNQQEYTNIRTTDQAREQRESFSHTTQLTQMYHQLSSYHLGTNRAVFFLLPRPHIIQAEATFVNGPRLLEGIQEVFLVVLRPDDVEDICVEAYLETAHVVSTPKFQSQTSTGTLTLHVEKYAEDVSGSFGDDSSTTYAENSEVYTPPDGWEVDLSRNGGYKIESASGDRIEGYSVTEATVDHVTVWGKVSAWFEDRTWPAENVSHNGRLDVVVTVYIRKKKQDIVGYSQNLWLTGRGVCCCPTRIFTIPFGVLWETPLDVEYVMALNRNVPMTAQQANLIRSRIGHHLLRSVNDPDRYPAGTVGFTEAQFLTQSLAELIRRQDHPDNVPINEIAGLDPAIREKVAAVAPKVSRRRLLQMSLAEQMDRFGLTTEEAAKLRRSAVGLEGPAPDPAHRWDRPGQTGTSPQPGQIVAPDVVGQDLEKAKQLIESAQLKTGTVTWQDNAAPRGQVVNQVPDNGTRLPEGAEIDLVVSTGANVLIPELSGKSLSDALALLKESGIVTEPEIVYSASKQPRNQVIEVTPAPGSSVTPHAEVILHVSRGQKNQPKP